MAATVGVKVGVKVNYGNDKSITINVDHDDDIDLLEKVINVISNADKPSGLDSVDGTIMSDEDFQELKTFIKTIKEPEESSFDETYQKYLTYPIPAVGDIKKQKQLSKRVNKYLRSLIPDSKIKIVEYELGEHNPYIVEDCRALESIFKANLEDQCPQKAQYIADEEGNVKVDVERYMEGMYDITTDYEATEATEAKVTKDAKLVVDDMDGTMVMTNIDENLKQMFGDDMIDIKGYLALDALHSKINDVVLANDVNDKCLDIHETMQNDEPFMRCIVRMFLVLARHHEMCHDAYTLEKLKKDQTMKYVDYMTNAVKNVLTIARNKDDMKNIIIYEYKEIFGNDSFMKEPIFHEIDASTSWNILIPMCVKPYLTPLFNRGREVMDQVLKGRDLIFTSLQYIFNKTNKFIVIPYVGSIDLNDLINLVKRSSKNVV
jgi:hypothetical protein